MSSLTRSRTRRAAPIAAAALLLTACATEEEPTPIFAEPIATVTPKAEPAPKKESVREFLERWAEAEHEYQTTGSADTYTPLVENCAPCDEFMTIVDRIHSAGGGVSTQPRTINSVKRVARGQFHVSITNEPTTYTESDGGPTVHLDGGTLPYLFHLSPRGDSFVLNGMEVLVQ